MFLRIFQNGVRISFEDRLAFVFVSEFGCHVFRTVGSDMFEMLAVLFVFEKLPL